VHNPYLFAWIRRAGSDRLQVGLCEKNSKLSTKEGVEGARLTVEYVGDPLRGLWPHNPVR